MYRVVKNNCNCHPETCCHWDWYILDPDGHTVFGNNDLKFINKRCAYFNNSTPKPKEEQTTMITHNKHQNVLTQVAKILDADNSASIGFCDGEICHVDINGAEFNLVNIEDQVELDKVLDAIVLLKQHKLV